MTISMIRGHRTGPLPLPPNWSAAPTFKTDDLHTTQGIDYQVITDEGFDQDSGDSASAISSAQKTDNTTWSRRRRAPPSAAPSSASALPVRKKKQPSDRARAVSALESYRTRLAPRGPLEDPSVSEIYEQMLTQKTIRLVEVVFEGTTRDPGLRTRKSSRICVDRIGVAGARRISPSEGRQRAFPTLGLGPVPDIFALFPC